MVDIENQQITRESLHKDNFPWGDILLTVNVINAYTKLKNTPVPPNIISEFLTQEYFSPNFSQAGFARTYNMGEKKFRNIYSTTHAAVAITNGDLENIHLQNFSSEQIELVESIIFRLKSLNSVIEELCSVDKEFEYDWQLLPHVQDFIEHIQTGLHPTDYLQTDTFVPSASDSSDYKKASLQLLGINPNHDNYSGKFAAPLLRRTLFDHFHGEPEYRYDSHHSKLSQILNFFDLVAQGKYYSHLDHKSIYLKKFAGDLIPEIQYKLFEREQQKQTMKLPELLEVYFHLSQEEIERIGYPHNPFQVPNIHERLTSAHKLQVTDTKHYFTEPAWLEFVLQEYMTGNIRAVSRLLNGDQIDRYTELAIGAGVEFILHIILGNISSPSKIPDFYNYKTKSQVNNIFKKIGAAMAQI